jgi:hypothetical protein
LIVDKAPKVVTETLDTIDKFVVDVKNIVKDAHGLVN